MQTYELTIVLPGSSTPAKKKTAIEKIEKLVRILEGKVVESDDWGDKGLAYEIQGNSTGTFLFFRLELNNRAAVQINEKLKREKEIVRYLLVRSG